MKKIFAALCASFVLGTALISCSSMSGVHADVIGFNDDVFTYYKFYSLENNRETTKISEVIESIPSGRNTAEYYAMDIALDRIAEIADSDDENSRKSYYLILLTDGLDNVSVEMAKRNGKGKYANDDEYAAALKKRMETILNTKKGKSNNLNVFQAYPLMIYGKDLQDSGLSTEDCVKILKTLAGAQNAESPEPIVNSSPEEILKQFEKTFVVSSFSFEVPKGYVGKSIEMRFYCGSKEVSVRADFECQIKKKKETYILKNITCSDRNLDFDQKSMLQIVADEDYDSSENLVSFTFSNIKYGDTPSEVKNPTQWYNFNGKYVKNSEYTGKSDRQTDSYILLVLDTSESLGREGRRQANNIATNIIKLVWNKLSSTAR